MLKKKLSIILLTFAFISGCYTVLNHPLVQYSEKLGVLDTTVFGGRTLLTKINFSDNCSKCHSDYNYSIYYQPKNQKSDSSKGVYDKVHQFNNVPWWSNRVWSIDQANFDDPQQSTRRSKRSYRKISSGSSGELQYMAAPGVIPLNSKSLKDNSQQVKSGQKRANPTRQKEAPSGIKNDNDNKDKKKPSAKPKRRR